MLPRDKPPPASSRPLLPLPSQLLSRKQCVGGALGGSVADKLVAASVIDTAWSNNSRTVPDARVYVDLMCHAWAEGHIHDLYLRRKDMDSIRHCIDAIVLGRCGATDAATAGVLARPLAEAVRRYRIGGLPTHRPDRIPGDSNVIIYAATQMHAEFFRHIGPDSKYGVVRALKAYLETAIQRALKRHAEGSDSASPPVDADRWRVLLHGKPMERIAKAALLLALRITALSPRRRRFVEAWSPPRPYNAEKALARALRCTHVPDFVRVIVAEASGWLHEGRPGDQAAAAAAAAAAEAAVAARQLPTADKRVSAPPERLGKWDTTGPADESGDEDSAYESSSSRSSSAESDGSGLVEDEGEGSPAAASGDDEATAARPPPTPGSYLAFWRWLRDNPLNAVYLRHRMIGVERTWVEEHRERAGVSVHGLVEAVVPQCDANANVAAEEGEEEEEVGFVDITGGDEGAAGGDDDDDADATGGGDDAAEVGSGAPRPVPSYLPHKLSTIMPLGRGAARSLPVRLDGQFVCQCSLLPDYYRPQGYDTPVDVAFRLLFPHLPLRPGESRGVSAVTDGHSISFAVVRATPKSIAAVAAKTERRAQAEDPAAAALAVDVDTATVGVLRHIASKLLPPIALPIMAQSARDQAALRAAFRNGIAGLPPPPPPPPPPAPGEGRRATMSHQAHGHAPPRRVASSRPGEYAPWERLVRVDSGATNIVTCVETLADGTQRVWKLTRKEWRDRTQAERRLSRARLWTAALRRPAAQGAAPDTAGAFVRLAAADAPLAQTSDLGELARYLQLRESVQDEVWAEMRKRRWRHAAFRAWQVRGQVLAQFWGRVRAGRLEDGTAGVTPMVAYGDASFSSSGRGRPTAPTTAVLKACCDVMGPGAVVLVTEHRSSKCCADCGHVMRKVFTLFASPRQQRKEVKAAARAAARGRVPRRERVLHYVRGLMLCGNLLCSRASSLKDRDINATENIELAFLALDMGLPLPAHMQQRNHKKEDATNYTVNFIIREPPKVCVSLRDGDGWETYIHRVAAREAKAATTYPPPSWPALLPADPTRLNSSQRRLARRAELRRVAAAGGGGEIGAM